MQVHAYQTLYGASLIFSSIAMSYRPACKAAQEAGKKTRVIVTTDGEIDDRCSMIRFLLYANEWDIQGLIHSSSKHHWKGDGEHPRKRWQDVSWLDRQIDAYAIVYPSLKKHHPDYPSPGHLRDQVFVGNIAYEGDMAKSTPGSDRIAKVLLDEDPSPVWIQAWGGPNTIARALRTIEEEAPEKMAAVSHKTKLFLITEQDATYRDYISKKWPDVLAMVSHAYGAIAYRWDDIMEPELKRYFDGPWMKRNILTGHGPLCALYEARKDGSFRSEGDSPSFMNNLAQGLASEDHPSYGGWGGRFVWTGDAWRSAKEEGNRYASILRWAPAFQNDWAARADWCVKSPSEANHNPVAVCLGDRSKKALNVAADPEEKVPLSAVGSFDMDGDALSYQWWVYKEAGTYWEDVPISGADMEEATIKAPSASAGRTIHVILEVRDNGMPPLTAYKRVILTVNGNPLPTPAGVGSDELYLKTPITRLSGPPASMGKHVFYRGINLNGPAIEIDGNAWDGDDAEHFKCDEPALNCPKVRLRPSTDDARAKMIHAFRWSSHARMALLDVPLGTYAVYAYVWEDNNPETFNISLNGRVVEENYDSGAEGEWHRLGPWILTVPDGAIQIESDGGAANFSGIEVWRSVPAFDASEERTFPKQSWERRNPASLGLDENGLDKFSAALGGHGCAIRRGYLAK